MRTSSFPGARARRSLASALLCAAAAVPTAAHAHIQLESATPAPGAVLAAPPGELYLRFSAHIEARYTSITLVAPDGTSTPLSDVVFEPGSDRALRVTVRVRGAGRYTVRWRTAGADGHVIEGSYDFTVAADSAAVQPDLTAGHPPTAPPAHMHGAAQGTPHSATAPPDIVARWLHFTALLALLGALGLRVLLLPRLALDAAAHGTVQRRAWRTLAFAALALALAAVLRLWLQSVALHGSERAWSAPLLSMMLTDTSWGRAWLVQAVLLAVLSAGIAWARPPRDRLALLAALPAAVALSAIPAMTGHAAGAEQGAALVIANDALHVLAAGVWIGTLALLVISALPALRGDAGTAGTAAHAVDAFSPVALTAAGIVAATGGINALLHFGQLVELWTTAYGRTLLIKLAFVAFVFAAGAYNWRVVRPTLGGTDDVRRLRRSAGLELLFAFAVLVATAVLTGLPRP